MVDQLAGLEATIELQDGNISALLQELHGQVGQLDQLKDQQEAQQADLKLAQERTVQAEAEAERAESESKQYLGKSRTVENECAALRKNLKSSQRKLREMEQDLQQRDAEIVMLKEIVNSLKIQVRAKSKKQRAGSRVAGFEPTKRAPSRNERGRMGGRTSRTVPPPTSREDTPLLLP